MKLKLSVMIGLERIQHAFKNDIQRVVANKKILAVLTMQKGGVPAEEKEYTLHRFDLASDSSSVKGLLEDFTAKERSDLPLA